MNEKCKQGPIIVLVTENISFHSEDLPSPFPVGCRPPAGHKFSVRELVALLPSLNSVLFLYYLSKLRIFYIFFLIFSKATGLVWASEISHQIYSIFLPTHPFCCLLPRPVFPPHSNQSNLFLNGNLDLSVSPRKFFIGLLPGCRSNFLIPLPSPYLLSRLYPCSCTWACVPTLPDFLCHFTAALFPYFCNMETVDCRV